MNNAVHRRTLLKASGVSLALPLLECMPSAQAKEEAPAPKRLVFVCTTLGLHPPSLWPKTAGSEYESTEYLELLKAHRQDFTLFSGLAHEGQAGRIPHNCELTWLTSARGPGLDGFRNTVSVDQLAANHFGYVTRFPSIVLGSNSQQSQSFTSSGVMVPAETSPANLFAKLFLSGPPAQVKKQKQQLSDGRSILDQLSAEATKLKRKASTNDSRHLEEFFDSVRQAEKDISEAEAWMAKPKPTVSAKQPADIGDRADLAGRTRLLMNMVPLILQTDSSRVISVMIQDHQVVPKIDGVSGEHHNLSHHGQDRAKIEQLRKIESELVKCFGELLSSLKSKQENDRTLLQNASILFGSNLGNANSHESKNLPIFLAGGDYKHGRFVPNKPSDGVPLCNLFLRMLHDADVPAKSFGQSTAPLTW